MGTDVSKFKSKYTKKFEIKESSLHMPRNIKVTLEGIHDVCRDVPQIEYLFTRVPFKTRYGTNPHQDFGLYRPKGRSSHIGRMKIHKMGKDGLSLTNLQDMSHAIQTLKYFNEPTAIILKHLVPCGFASATSTNLTKIYQDAFSGDPRAAFGGTVAFNTLVDEETAEATMNIFTENILATGYTEAALTTLRKNEKTKKRNNGIRIIEVSNMITLPKFVGDDVRNHLTLRSLPTGEIALETPYLTDVRSIDDFIIDPQVDDVVAERHPTEQELQDGLIAWYLAINTRSNAVTIVKNRMGLAVGTGQQDRIGAVKNAILKAQMYNPKHLEGAVLASDAFFPMPDSIDVAAEAGIKAFVWPAGSRGDKKIISAGNKYSMAMMVPKTGERCFAHF